MRFTLSRRFHTPDDWLPSAVIGMNARCYDAMCVSILSGKIPTFQTNSRFLTAHSHESTG